MSDGILNRGHCAREIWFRRGRRGRRGGGGRKREGFGIRD